MIIRKVLQDRQGKWGRGFTLIELLVVISIIALLLSILMPSLQKVRMQAKGLVCNTQLKQVGLAMTTYASDYKGKTPPSLPWEDRLHTGAGEPLPYPPNDPVGVGLLAGTYIQLTDGKFYYCPSSTESYYKYDGQPNQWEQFKRGEWACMGYYYRHAVATAPLGTGKYGGDQSRVYPNSSYNLAKDSGRRCIMSDVFSGGFNFHKTGYNLLYLDGHTEFYKENVKKIADARYDYRYTYIVWLKYFDN